MLSRVVLTETASLPPPIPRILKAYEIQPDNSSAWHLFLLRQPNFERQNHILPPGRSVVLKLTVVCDGKEVVKLSGKRVFTLTVDANTSHQCSDKTDESRHVLPLVFAVNPGEGRFAS
jgi:hypothetical protein